MLERLDLVAVDVDGTITHEEPYIHLGAVRSLRSLGEKVPVALVTGNPFPIAYALSVYLRLSPHVIGIAENGGVVYFGAEHRLIGDLDSMKKVKEFIKKRGYGKYLSEDSKFRHVDVALRMDPGTQERLIEEIRSEDLDVEITTSGYALHIMPRGVNKGAGLLTLCRELNVDPNHVAAIGDSHNDLDMFSVVGLSIALPNAPEEVRERADIVVGGPGYGYSLPLAVRVLKRLPSSHQISFPNSPS